METTPPTPPGDCWEWDGYRNPEGYGRTNVRNGDGTYRKVLVHRATYEALHGPIPDGLTIDHLCRNRACCNPAHLEAVTHRENIMRGNGVAPRNAAKTHCPQGHEYDEANTAYRNDPHRARVCRACNRERVRRHRAAKKAST